MTFIINVFFHVFGRDLSAEMQYAAVFQKAF